MHLEEKAERADQTLPTAVPGETPYHNHPAEPFPHFYLQKPSEVVKAMDIALKNWILGVTLDAPSE